MRREIRENMKQLQEREGGERIVKYRNTSTYLIRR